MLESLISGGLFGILGSSISSITGYFKQKQEHKQNVEMFKLEHQRDAAQHGYALEEMKFEAQYKTEQLQIESEGKIAVGELEALTASHKSIVEYTGDNKLLVVAEFARKITRPLLTFMMVFLTTGVYFSSDGEMRDTIARAVVAMTATIISWWFADRQISKQIASRVL